MASVLKDPAVVEHVDKQVAKAVAASNKAAIKKLKDHAKDHVAGLGDDKAAAKAVGAFVKSATTALAAPAATA
jgi:hypothetical protein